MVNRLLLTLMAHIYTGLDAIACRPSIGAWQSSAEKIWVFNVHKHEAECARATVWVHVFCHAFMGVKWDASTAHGSECVGTHQLCARIIPAIHDERHDAFLGNPQEGCGLQIRVGAERITDGFAVGGRHCRV